MAILRDGTKLQNVRTALLSRWITRRLKLNDKTDSTSPVHGRRVIRSLLITFSSTMTVPHGPQRHPWPQCGFYYYSSLLEVTCYVYFDVILEELFSSSITNSKLFSDAPFSGIRLFNQSISVVMNLTSLHSKHAYYMQHKTIINDQFTQYQPYWGLQYIVYTVCDIVEQSTPLHRANAEWISCFSCYCITVFIISVCLISFSLSSKRQQIQIRAKWQNTGINVSSAGVWTPIIWPAGVHPSICLTLIGSGGSRKNIWGPGSSSFGRQQRLSEITIEPIKNLGAWARFRGTLPPALA